MNHAFVETLESRQLLSAAPLSMSSFQSRLDHLAAVHSKQHNPAPTLTATLAASTLSTETNRYTFDVTYSGYTKAKWHLGDQRIVVTGPNGYRVIARLVSARNTRSPQVTATYIARAPEGGWTEAANGTYTVTLRGKLGNHGPRTIVPLGTFDVAINVAPPAVNAAPTFTPGADQTVAQDSGPQTVTAWATNISPGADSESAQTLAFQATTDNDALFSALPAIASDGTLTYTPAAGASGTATITLVLKDDGGTANGGVDTSAPVTFVISVTPATPQPIV